ncbi:MAG: ATP synthase F1 subunit gamma [Candidatus Aminicenantes bacterium]|nr:ATP synthase F1 subunit gamma [Candidatus Aminicenantes bacterium]
MPALLDLRRRIRSIRSTQQVTKAMKTVATARFKKFHRLVLENRPFWHEEPPVLAKLLLWAAAIDSVFTEERPETKCLIGVVTSDKGLCGAFNSNLLERGQALLDEKEKRGIKFELLLMGKKAVNYFRHKKYSIFRAIGEKVDRLPETEIKLLAREIINLYLIYRIDSFYVIYNEFRSILAPTITVTQLLPLARPQQKELSVIEPDWEPEAKWLVERLIPLYLERQIKHIILESQAAEQAARMMAMENATNNAEELISDLILVMNKIRQASITKELLEIMTAVEALSKSR